MAIYEPQNIPESSYTNCDDCGAKILQGDVRHMHTGADVCEYCSDNYEPEEKDY